jgi:Family of unknown function (DUF5706)
VDRNGWRFDLSFILFVVTMTFDRLSTAETHLDRTHAFFPRIDSKFSVLLAMGLAECAVLLLNLSPGDFALWYINVPICVFAFLVSAMLAKLYHCAFPHLDGGERSLVYFAEIAKLEEAKFIAEYTSITHDALLRDLTAQIWRNSEIVSVKFKALKTATMLLLLSLLPWATALCATSLTHNRLPVFDQ